jgi:hypothetical protein
MPSPVKRFVEGMTQRIPENSFLSCFWLLVPLFSILYLFLFSSLVFVCCNNSYIPTSYFQFLSLFSSLLVFSTLCDRFCLSFPTEFLLSFIPSFQHPFFLSFSIHTPSNISVTPNCRSISRAYFSLIKKLIPAARSVFLRWNIQVYKCILFRGVTFN